MMARVTRWTFRPLVDALPDTARGVAVLRAAFTTVTGALGQTLAGTRISPVREPNGDTEIRGEWLHGSSARNDAVILYMHGGAYVACSARTHRSVTSRLAAWSELPVFACDYRLAPRHAFPAAAIDVRATYEWLIAQGFAPERIVLAGDSAGGHLALDLALELHRTKQPMPGALVLLSPLVDPTLEFSARDERERPDAMFSAASARKLLALYMRDVSPSHPRLSLVIGPGDALPPTLIQVGSTEGLVADARRLADALGSTCTLEVWPGQIHVFQALSRVVPEATHALRAAAAHVRAALESA